MVQPRPGVLALALLASIVAVYGRSGRINDFASLLGAPRWQILYGLSGILLAHVVSTLRSMGFDRTRMHRGAIAPFGSGDRSVPDTPPAWPILTRRH